MTTTNDAPGTSHASGQADNSTAGNPTADGGPGRGGGIVKDPARRWWVLVAVALAQLMVVLSVTIANIALPQAQLALGMTPSQRQWVITGYALAFGSFLLLGGRLGDVVGRRGAFILGLIGFAGSSAVAGAAPTFGVLAAARFVQGASGAILAPAALAVLTTTFTSPRERAKAFGVFSSISGAGAGIGLLAGGALTSALSWRWCFYLQLPFAIVAAAAGLFLLRGGRPRAGEGPVRLDWGGALATVVGLAAIVLGMTRAVRDGWGAPSTLGLLAGGVVVLGAFVLWEARAAQPLLPLDVVRDRDRAASFLAVFVLGAASSGVFYFMTFYLQQVRGLSAIVTGVAFMPMVLTIIVAAYVVNTHLLGRLGPRILVSVGMVLCAAGLAFFAALRPDSSYWLLAVPGLVLMGLGYGCILAPGMARATLGVSHAHAGAAGGLVNTCQQVGLAVGTALLSAVAASVTGADASAGAAVSGYSAAYLVGAGIFIAGAVAEFLLFRPGADRRGAAEKGPETSAGQRGAD